MRILVGFLLFAADPPNLTLHLRSRVAAFRGSGQPQLVIQHLEKYWAPTMLSKDLLAALR